MKFILKNQDAYDAAVAVGLPLGKIIWDNPLWQRPEEAAVLEVISIAELKPLLALEKYRNYDFTLSFPEEVDEAGEELYELKIHYPGYCDGL